MRAGHPLHTLSVHPEHSSGRLWESLPFERTSMNSRVVSLFLGVAFIPAPAFAQIRPASNSGPGGGGAIQQVAADLAALTARIAKLEGGIVAADLAGTYSMTVVDTSMRGFRAGPPAEEARITTSVLKARVTLNADGTANVAPQTGNTSPACEASTLALPSGAMHGFDCSESAADATWTYVDGVLTITFPDEDEQIALTVAAGGRFLMTAFAPFHPEDRSSNQVLFILTRLK